MSDKTCTIIVPPYTHEPDEKHDVKFKPTQLPDYDDVSPNFVIVKPKCEICGATEETETCNRTFYL